MSNLPDLTNSSWSVFDSSHPET